jgi:hypothetical protein
MFLLFFTHIPPAQKRPGKHRIPSPEGGYASGYAGFTRSVEKTSEAKIMLKTARFPHYPHTYPHRFSTVSTPVEKM